MSIRACLLVLSLALLQLIDAQTYLPRAVPRTICSQGTYTTFGHNNITRLASQTTSAPSNYINIRAFNGSAGAVITQLSYGIAANTISTVTFLRLGLFLVTPTGLTVVGQTDEISIYTTPADIIYADLLQPVTLSNAVYAVGAWHSLALNTGADPVPTTYNAPYQCYACVTSAPLFGSYPFSYYYGEKALAAHGCATASQGGGDDPYTAPNTELYSVCAYVQESSPAARDPTYQWNYEKAAVTTTYLVSATLAVSTTNTGSTATGTWNLVNAANGPYTSSSSSAWYYPDSGQTTTSRSLVLGPGRIPATQRIYPNGATKVDESGLSFVQADGNQIIVSFTNNSYRITEYQGTAARVLTGQSSGFEIRRMSSINDARAVCVAPQRLPATPPLVCPTGSTEVVLGSDSREIADKAYTSEWYYIYANHIYMQEFTAFASNIELRQLTLLINRLPNTVARVRMAIFAAATPGSTSYRLLGQTNEIVISNVDAPTTLRGNLITPLTLTRGQNYTMSIISDVGIYAPTGYWKWPTPGGMIDTYDYVAGNGWPTTLEAVGNWASDQPFMAAHGCVANIQPVSYSFCAQFVYAYTTKVFQGVLTTLPQDQTDAQGTYRPVIGAYGKTYVYDSYDEENPLIYNFTRGNFDLPANQRLYISAQGAAAVDDFGFSLLTFDDWDAYTVQIRSFYDPNSASRELLENYQYHWTTSMYSDRNLVSSLTMQPYSGGNVPSCPLLPRPANLVTPASVARVACPNLGNSIADTFGDAQVANFENNQDGTTVQANRVYTYPFTPENNAVIRQFAVGILNNMDQTPTILVRLGLYSRSDNTLLAQSAQISLYQAIDQMIVVNLPTPVNIVSGQQYLIALMANNPLEVATHSASTAPTMTATWSTTGLPATFAFSATDTAPAVSIAAFACVDATHSFCGYNMLFNPTTRSAQTHLYQGLLEAAPSTQTNPTGSYRAIWAAAGRFTSATRTGDYPSNTMAVQTYAQTSGTSANVYTSGNSNQPLDSTGLSFTLADGTVHTIQYVNGAYQFARSGQSVGQWQSLYSGFSVLPLNSEQGIPGCGLLRVPSRTPSIPAPSCGTQDPVSYGTSDPFGVRYATEGSTTAYFNRIYTRPFTSAAGRPTILTHLSFGILTSLNTHTRMRFALYSANGTLMSATEEITLTNPVSGSYGAALLTPQYLEPNTVYMMATWIENGVYAGYDTSVTDSIELGFNGNSWPAQWGSISGKNGDNMRAIGAQGCTTNPPVVPTAPVRVSSSSTAAARSSSAQVATSQPTPTSTPNQPSSSSGSAPVVITESSSNSANLSNGAVAGLVIGCVIGANLLLLVIFWLCCFTAGAVGGKALNSSKYESEQSRVSEPSKIEMGEVTTADETD